MPKLITKRVEKIDHWETGRQGRAEREKIGVSLRKIAELMGIGAPYLSDLETGRRNWTNELMGQYQNALKGIKT